MNDIPVVRQTTVTIGYGPREALDDTHHLINNAMKDMLRANDGYGSKVLRQAILDSMNELQRLVAGKFIKAGVADAGDYYTAQAKRQTNGNSEQS